LFGKNYQNNNFSNKRLPMEKDPTNRIVNRLNNLNYNMQILIQLIYKINLFRLKSYDEPLKSPEFVSRLSDVQTIPSSIIYRQGHLLNIVQLNIKQIVEFIK